MSRARTIGEVVRNGFCSGCGLCESIAGPDVLPMRVTNAGFMRPHATGARLEPHVEERILKVCPGARIDGPAVEPDTPVHLVWGPIRELRRAWASDPAVRHRAAAGGLLTALGQFLIATGEVDAIVHVRASATRPMLTEAAVSRTVDEVLEAAQSRYGPAAPLVHVHRLLEEGARFAVVAKPCDISAVRRLSHVDDRVNRQVPYLLTMFCGGVHSLGATNLIVRHLGFEPAEVRRVRYRGDGWPGATRVESHDGMAGELTYDETWHDRSHPWVSMLQFRCKICPDSIGEAADISAPDGWIVENGRPIYDDAPGVNVAVVRTEAGSRLLHAAVAAGYVALAPIDVDELEPMHAGQAQRKRAGPARRLALWTSRGPHLVVRDLRSTRLFRSAGAAENIRAFAGAHRRLRSRTNLEPLPREKEGGAA